MAIAPSVTEDSLRMRSYCQYNCRKYWIVCGEREIPSIILIQCYYEEYCASVGRLTNPRPTALVAGFEEFWNFKVYELR